MNWRDYLRPDEVEQLAGIKAESVAGKRQSKKIRDRCRQRALREGKKS